MSQIQILVDKIRKAATAYYHTDTPITSDQEFDSWCNELRSISPDHPILSAPDWWADTPVTHKNKFNHTFMVGGLDKVQSVDLDESMFDSGDVYYQSEKLDGLTGVAYYGDVDKNGGRSLKYVLTRNDGVVGLDITNNLRYAGVPKYVPAEVEWIRGEIVTTWDAAKKYDYSHPRNMACGLANSDELTEAHTELRFIAFDCSGSEVLSERLKKIGGWLLYPYQPSTNAFGALFTTSLVFECHKIFFDYSLYDHKIGPYPVDGSVVTNMTTGKSFAIKYPTPSMIVEVVKVVDQVSSRGRVIPVIEFTPVSLSGAVLTFCSGFNYDSIKSSGIGPGAKIKITRANEVIPHWVSTVEPSSSVVIPSTVEVDGKQYTTKWVGCHLEISLNKEADSISSLMGSRAPLGIGGAKIKSVIEKYAITSHKKLAEVAKSVFETNSIIYSAFHRAYEDRIIEMFVSIHKGFTLAELLESTYSRNLGGEAADRLMNIFNNDPKNMFGHLEYIGGVEKEISDKMPSYVVAEGIKENLDLIMSVLSSGLVVKSPDLIVEVSADLIPITLTGTLSKPRSSLMTEWKLKAIEVEIGKAKYLITDNPGSGSSKNKAAAKLGIPVITESEFRQIIGVA